MTQTMIDEMTAAATAFLDSLDAGQRAVAHWPWPSEDERRLWFYTPTDHGGVPLGDLSPGRQRLAMRLLATGTSTAAYNTISTIMGLDNVLDHVEGWWAMWGRERGRDPGRFYATVFGDPGSRAWGWRFGGHHVSVNHTVLDGRVCATPFFLGADPASAPLLGGHLLRPLGAVEDLGRDLVHALDDHQRAAAVVSPVAPIDIAGANRPRVSPGDVPLPLPEVWRGRFTGADADKVDEIERRGVETAGLRPEHIEAVRMTAQPKGLAAAVMTGAQQEILRALLDCYLARVPDDLAASEAAKFAGDRLAALHFAWAGGLRRGEGHYYRIQGPGLLAEYDNTQRGANHVHSVWRDPDRDFGGDPLGRHLASGHS